MFDIAATAFDEVDHEEKLKYEAKIKQTGTYIGYKLPQYWVSSYRCRASYLLTFHQHIANGVRDRIEHYNCE